MIRSRTEIKVIFAVDISTLYQITGVVGVTILAGVTRNVFLGCT